MEYPKLNIDYKGKTLKGNFDNRQPGIGNWMATHRGHSSWGILVAFFSCVCGMQPVFHLSFQPGLDAALIAWHEHIRQSGCPAGIIIIYINLSGHQRRDLSESKLGAHLQLRLRLQVQVQVAVASLSQACCTINCAYISSSIRIYFYF